MRTVLFLAMVLCALPAISDDAVVGDSRADVMKKHGRPTGRVRLEDREILYYFRGYIELRDGTTTAVKLDSVNEADRKRREREGAQLAADAEYRERMIEAEEEKNRLLSDADFKTNSAAVQATMWNEFKEKYPDAVMPEEYNKVVDQKQKDEAAAAAQIAEAQPTVYPKLSGSKRKKYRRAHNTNRVEIVVEEERP